MKTAPILTGIALGAVAGTAVSMVSSHHAKRKSTMNKVKHTAGKALKTAGAVMQSMAYAMK